MDRTKIETILSDSFGISSPFNKWMKLPQVSTIYLNIDPNIFVSTTDLYYFDSSNEMLLISSSGSYKRLTTVQESLDSYPITSAFPFEIIGGFIGSTEHVAYGTYYTKLF